MPPATFDETTVDITAGDYLFRVKGSVPKFPGWMAVYGQALEETATGSAAASGANGAPRSEGAVRGVGAAGSKEDKDEMKIAPRVCCRRSRKAIASS